MGAYEMKPLTINWGSPGLDVIDVAGYAPPLAEGSLETNLKETLNPSSW